MFVTPLVKFSLTVSLNIYLYLRQGPYYLRWNPQLCWCYRRLIWTAAPLEKRRNKERIHHRFVAHHRFPPILDLISATLSLLLSPLPFLATHVVVSCDAPQSMTYSLLISAFLQRCRSLNQSAVTPAQLRISVWVVRTLSEVQINVSEAVSESSTNGVTNISAL